VTVVAASGDIGAVGEPCQLFKGLAGGAFAPVKEANLPASDPLVLAAGGTTLTASHKTGTYISESAWGLPFGDPAATSRRQAAASAASSRGPGTKITYPASGPTGACPTWPPLPLRTPLWR
jgi:subtilase family serine protease